MVTIYKFKLSTLIQKVLNRALLLQEKANFLHNFCLKQDQADSYPLSATQKLRVFNKFGT